MPLLSWSSLGTHPVAGRDFHRYGLGRPWVLIWSQGMPDARPDVGCGTNAIISVASAIFEAVKPCSVKPDCLIDGITSHSEDRLSHFK